MAHLTSSPEATASLEQNAVCLKGQLDQIRSHLEPGKKFHIIAHSMGGLVSRAYIETRNDGQTIYQNDVANLFTLGTPHKGINYNVLSPFAHLAGNVEGVLQPVVHDMSAPFINIGENAFNVRYPTRNPQVKYYEVGGELSFWDASLDARALLFLIQTPSDGLVTLNSSTGLDGSVQSYTSAEAHSREWGLQSYFHPTPGDTLVDSLQFCVLPVVLGDQNGCVDTTPLSVSAANPQADAFVPISRGQLSTGQAINATVALDKAGLAVFGTTVDSGAISMTLTSPNGQLIDESYAAAHPSEVTYEAGESGVFYTVNTAQAGTWTVHLSNASTVLNYSSFVVYDSNTVLTVTSDKTSYTVGQTANISAQITSVNSSSITATVIYHDGSSQVISFSGSGSSYTGTLIVPNKLGYASVKVAINGVMTSGSSYKREQIITFNILAGSSGQSQSIYLPIIIK